MAVAASLDLVLTAKTDKLESGLDAAIAELGEFKGKVKSFTAAEEFELAASGMRNLSNATQQYVQSLNKTGGAADSAFAPGKLIGWLITFESIKKAIELVKKQIEAGFFDAQTTAELTNIGTSFDNLKGKFSELLASAAIFFKPLIDMASEWGGKLLEGLTAAIDKFNEFSGQFRDVLRGSKGPPKVVGLTDSAKKELQSDAFKKFQEDRKKKPDPSPAIAILESLKGPAEHLADKAKILRDEFRKGNIDAGQYQQGIAAIQKQWDDSMESASKLSEAERERRQSAKQLFDQTRTPLERFHGEMAKLKSLVASGAISTDVFWRGMSRLHKELRDTDPAIVEATKRFEQMRDRAKSLRENNMTPMERFAEGIQEVQSLLASGLLSPRDAERQIRSLLKDRPENQPARAEVAEVGSQAFASLIANPAGQNAQMEELRLATEANRYLFAMAENIRRMAERGGVQIAEAPG